MVSPLADQVTPTPESVVGIVGLAPLLESVTGVNHFYFAINNALVGAKPIGRRLRHDRLDIVESALRFLFARWLVIILVEHGYCWIV